MEEGSMAILLRQLQELRTEMQVQRQQYQEENDSLRAELRAVQNQQPDTCAATTTTTTPSILEAASFGRPRPRHPDVEPFNGEDLKDYPPFRMNLRTKFAIDAACYSTGEEQVYYAYSRLRGKASQRILPWLQARQESGTTVEWGEFAAVLDKAFGDPDRQRKALVRINTMKQGKRDLEEFLNEFDEVLLSAGGISWDDSQKKALLDTAVNWQLLKGMIGIPQADTYEAYCDQLRRVNHDIQRVERLSKGRARTTAAVGGAPTRRRSTSPPQPARPDPMEWEPIITQIAALREEVRGLKSTDRTKPPKRAVWVSAEERDKRKAREECIRCGERGHRVRGCRLLPPLPPKQVANIQRATPLNSDRESESEDSGKE